MEIALKEIKPNHKKERNKNNLENLIESMQEIGQVEPIIINGRNEIISGQRRFQAALAMGWKKIDASYFEKDAVDEEIASIDANLMVLPLGEVDHDQSLARRKKLYMQKHPDTAQYASKGETPSFTKEVGNMLGVTSRTIEHAIKRAEHASPALTEARREGKISSTVANLLVRLPKGYQNDLLPTLQGKSVAQVKRLVQVALDNDSSKAVAVAKQDTPQISNIFKTMARLKTMMLEEIDKGKRYAGSELKTLLEESDDLREVITDFIDFETPPKRVILRKSSAQRGRASEMSA